MSSFVIFFVCWVLQNKSRMERIFLMASFCWNFGWNFLNFDYIKGGIDEACIFLKWFDD